MLGVIDVATEDATSRRERVLGERETMQGVGCKTKVGESRGRGSTARSRTSEDCSRTGGRQRQSRRQSTAPGGSLTKPTSSPLTICICIYDANSAVLFYISEHLIKRAQYLTESWIVLLDRKYLLPVLSNSPDDKTA